jgi:DNA-binding transcriptional LysR family regulator
MVALEEALGAKLVNRLTTGCELTADGAHFLGIAERMEADLIAARAQVAGDTALAGTVRIGAPDGFGVAYLAGRLPELAATHPGLDLELVPVPRSFSLSRHEADIAITVDRPREGRLVAAKLVDYTLGLYASRGYAEAAGLPETAEALTRHRLVGYVPDLIVSTNLDYAAEFHPEWKANYAVSSALGQVEAVRAGAGIGILHAFIARRHDDLVPVSAIKPIRRAYWLVYHESVRPVRRVQAVAGFIAASVERDRALFA